MKEPTNLPWRRQLRGFPYGENVLKDKKYLEDRTELFLEHGNGWWWFPRIKKEYPNLKQYKKSDKKEK